MSTRVNISFESYASDNTSLQRVLYPLTQITLLLILAKNVGKNTKTMILKELIGLPAVSTLSMNVLPELSSI